MGIQTLHCHTKISDGQLTYKGVIDACKRYGISVVAFTDHDAVPTEKDLKKLKEMDLSCNGDKVDWVVGIEVSSGVPREFGDKAGGFHIVGLFVDPFDRELLEFCETIQEARVERMKKMVKNLSGLGFEITVDGCLAASQGEVVARPHIVQALLEKEQNLKVLDELRKKMADEAKKDPEVKAKYEKMLLREEKEHPYDLFLTDDAYLPGIYVPKGYWKSHDDSVQMIRNAGGLAFLAHYFTEVKKYPPEFLEKLLKEDRADGAETVFGLTEYAGKQREEITELQKLVRDLVKKHGKLESGGADAHLEEELKLFAEVKDFSEKTVGMIENIIEKSGVSTKWSSFK